MGKYGKLATLTLIVALAIPILLTSPVAAATAPEVAQAESFLKNMVQTLATFAGIIAAGFFVWGGYLYITSSGNPEHLDRAKRTLLYSAIGLVIVTIAFAIVSFVTSTTKGSFGG